MADNGDNQPLQFLPFASAIDVGFWHKLTKNKLEVYKLDETPNDVVGYYVNDDADGLPCCANVDYNGFECTQNTTPRVFPIYGTLRNKNTIEAFKTCDKKEILQSTANMIWDDIESGRALEDPRKLSRFSMLTFADLKKYNYYYWFAFPALVSNDSVASKVLSCQQISQFMTAPQIKLLQGAYDGLSSKMGYDLPFFLIKLDGEDVKVAQIKDWCDFYGNEPNNSVVVGFSDPSTLAKHPGWSLRNFLMLLSYNWGKNIKELKVVCYRDRIRNGTRDSDHSLVITLDRLPEPPPSKDKVNAVGWEKNKNQKMGPRLVNLSTTMDPVKLAESAVDLNLKLMRWRLLPDLQLDTISATKCLLLGSGTLGCNVARSLLAWGVRIISFLDNGRVSYSNPVRQTLFEFEDCKNGGKEKSQAASDAMRRIYPNVICEAHTLSIPMPGHAVNDSDDARKTVAADVEKLETLIKSHDAIFLLMDTRESRWLPTLLAAVHQKIVINAALGFDSFVVMRHGLKRAPSQDEANLSSDKEATISSSSVRIPGDKLGCYFCNDVVAPGDSTRDRTLDMQCTVTRPGVSMMASSLAVELLMSMLHHPDGGYCTAESSTTSDDNLSADFASTLGIVPHQIRGFLSRFHVVMPSCLSFDLCTGCSNQVIDAYRQDGFDFLLKVFNVPQYLEEMTGLLKLHQSTIDVEIWELSDDDDDENE